MLTVKGGRKGKLNKWLLVEILEKVRIPVKLGTLLTAFGGGKRCKDGEGKQNC